MLVKFYEINWTVAKIIKNGYRYLDQNWATYV